MIITSISERVILPGIIFSFIMLFLTFIFGRFFCGWVCPLGATIDIGGKVRKNILYRKSFPNRKLRISKFIILGIIALFSLFGVQLAWILDPMVIMARFVSLNLIPTITSISNSIFIYLIQQFNLYGWLYDFYRILKTTLLGVKPYYFDHSLIILLFFIVIVSTPLFVKRYWCRGLCPLGAFYALVCAILDASKKR